MTSIGVSFIKGGGGAQIIPPDALTPPIVISTASMDSAGSAIVGWGNTGTGNAAWPTANKAFYVPFVVRGAFTVAKFFWQNGTVSGNVDCGVYDENGTRLVSSGSIAQAGVSSTQIVDLTDTPLAAGLYYMAMAMDNGTGLVSRFSLGSRPYAQMTGTLCQTSAFPLPATATFASMDAVYIPSMAVTSRTVI